MSSAPTAASSPREKPPNAPRSATFSRSFSERSPLSGSKLAEATGVGAAPDHRQPALDLGLAQGLVRPDRLARRQPHDLAGEVGRRRAADLELAGRDVERGKRGAAPRQRMQGGQIVPLPGVEQRILGERAGRDQPHHVASNHGLGAALAGLGRILELLADRHPVALPDQPLQVVVGAHHRHAAHRDVLAEMLAALGQHDAERGRGNHRVLEEQLVEVAHPVPQDAVRIGGLDLEILRHRRRRARARRGGGGRRWIVGFRRHRVVLLAIAAAHGGARHGTTRMRRNSASMPTIISSLSTRSWKPARRIFEVSLMVSQSHPQT